MIKKSEPCLEKNCSWCCNPVKIVKFFPESKIPINKKGEKIWKKRNEILIPENEIDTVRLEAYDCDNFDNEIGKCKDYENRPEVCKNTSCIKDELEEGVDEQHKKFINQKFITIKNHV
jgi:Fe-S-cluster containining protein